MNLYEAMLHFYYMFISNHILRLLSMSFMNHLSKETVKGMVYNIHVLISEKRFFDNDAIFQYLSMKSN